MMLNLIRGSIILFAYLLSMAAATACDGSVEGVPGCTRCERGIVGSGPVKVVCPWCDGVLSEKEGSFSDRKPDTTEQVLGKVSHLRSVVRIVVAEGPSTSRGSGVVVDNGGKPLVLTAWHVVRTNASKNVPVVHFQDGTQAKGRVILSDDAYDIAAIECDRYGAQGVALAEAPATKQALAVVCYGPHPSTFREGRGRLIGRGRPSSEHAMDFIEISTEARQGDSGGPIFNDAGEVAGIVWGCRDGIAWGTHSGRIKAFLSGEMAALPKAKGDCANGRCRK